MTFKIARLIRDQAGPEARFSTSTASCDLPIRFAALLALEQLNLFSKTNQKPKSIIKGYEVKTWGLSPRSATG